MHCIGVGIQAFSSVTILSSPAGTPVSGSNTFSYRILSSVTLTCYTVPSTSSSNIQWSVSGCSTCFPSGQIGQTVMETNLTPEDAGTFTCTVEDGGDPYVSDSFTLYVDCK